MKQNFTKLFVTVAFCILTVGIALGQNITIKGTVTDGKLPLPGVGVTIKGAAASSATVTSPNGTFTISAPGNAVLVFSSIGFSPREIPVNNQTTITVSMSTSVQDLEQ